MMKSCPSCAMTVPPAAETCPHCHSDLTGIRQTLTIIGTVVVVIVLIGSQFQPSVTGTPVAAQETIIAEPAAEAAPFRAENDPRIVAARSELLKTRPFLDLTYNPDRPSVRWQIGVKNDGSRRVGLAEVACMTLAERELVDETTSVRIVDLRAVYRTGGDFRAASLGHVRCHDAADLGV